MVLPSACAKWLIVRLSTSRWCAGQSALHSISYLLFYLATGGLHSLWFDCFPAPLPDGQLNRLGLVNFLGLLAFVVLLALVLPAWPQLRRQCYHVFQRLHAPVAALFILCCALHDLPVLLFAVPGLSAWYIEWRSYRTRAPLGPLPRLLPAKARLLPGTSGPWVELTVDCGAALCPAPRGQWVSMRVVPLGKEWHPLSVTTESDTSATGSEQVLSVVVSARAGNWSQALAALAQPATSSFDVELAGPYPHGGGGWSLSGDPRQPALLLLAGGTGVTGWLPTLAAAGGGSRRCHLVWCVQNEADYRALAGRLPSQSRVKVTVYVTRGRAETTADGPLTIQAESGERATAAAVATAAAPQPHGRSLLTLVSLAAALVGLAVGYWGWMYVAGVLAHLPPDRGWIHQTLAGYTVTRRCLPIGLIGFSMAVTTAACSRALAHISRASSKRCRPADTEIEIATGAEVGAVSPRRPEPLQLPLFTTVSSSALRPSMPAPAPPQQDGSGPEPGWTGDGREADDGWAGHEVRMGRPDADALVLAAAAGLETQQLVVAACGPPALVDAARNAVAGARKVCHRVRIEFTGSDSRW